MTADQEPAPAALKPHDWPDHPAQLTRFQRLGSAHWSGLASGGKTLLVSFEALSEVQWIAARPEPIGWELVREQGWSHLGLISDGTTWFRDAEVFGLFDRLIEDGFFDSYEQVVFFGAGAGGYAAAAFSVAALSPRLVLVAPQATLDPRIAGWDRRFLAGRKLDFNRRYGYAPSLAGGAEEIFVLYDPHEAMDAMHAALFHGRQTTSLPMPFCGAEVLQTLYRLDTLYPVLQLAGTGLLQTHHFAKLHRRRRADRAYLQNLAQAAEARGHKDLAEQVCETALQTVGGATFRQTLRRLRG